ncbi:hypothetical protein, partial [Shigella boydii]
LVEKVGTYVTNTGLMATYGGQFTLTIKPTNKLKKFVRDAFLYESKWPQMFHLLGENCAVLAVKLVDKTKCTERLPMSI